MSRMRLIRSCTSKDFHATTDCPGDYISTSAITAAAAATTSALLKVTVLSLQYEHGSQPNPSWLIGVQDKALGLGLKVAVGVLSCSGA